MKKPARKPKVSVESNLRDNPEWTLAMIAEARPASEVLLEIFDAKMAAMMLNPNRGLKS